MNANRQRIFFGLRKSLVMLLWFGVSGSWSIPGMAQLGGEVPSGKTWNVPDATEISRSYAEWLGTTSLSLERQRELVTDLERQLGESTREPVLELFIQALVRGRPELGELVGEILATREQVSPQLEDQIDIFGGDTFGERHVRLFALDQFVRRGLFDEALGISEGVEAADVVQPQVLLMSRAIAHQQLLQKAEALANTRRLLEHKEALPQRYVTMAELIRRDLEGLEPETLGEIVRLMRDVERRTNLNRAGKRVLGQEAEVLAKLDRLIERLEEEQKQNTQAVAGKTDGPQKPLDDSRPVAGKGSGEVTKKHLSTGGNWGDLPAAEKSATLAEMTRELPPHFRSIVEEYFKSLAKQREDER
jgi:hypothetical protein